MAARFTEAQLGLLGFAPDGSRGAAVGQPPAPPPRPSLAPRVDPDGLDFIDLTYRGAVIGKKRPRASHRNGVFRVHNPPENVKAEQDLKAAMRLAMSPGFRTLDFAVQALLEIRYPIAGSWPKKRQAAAREGRIRPTGKPDVDNVLKLIFDAGNKLLWLDDAQVSSLVIERIYSADAPAIWLRVRRAPLTLPWESAA